MPMREICGSLIFFLLTAIAAQARQNAPPIYTGAGSCSSSNCHGSVWPKTGGNINQNEYTVWSTKDRHSKAYSVLLEPRSKQIARNLKIGKPEAEALCLNCHA